ncbi:hypothetical protein VPH35_021173 [Triticum aestivum]
MPWPPFSPDSFTSLSSSGTPRCRRRPCHGAAGCRPLQHRRQDRGPPRSEMVGPAPARQLVPLRVLPIPPLPRPASSSSRRRLCCSARLLPKVAGTPTPRTSIMETPPSPPPPDLLHSATQPPDLPVPDGSRPATRRTHASSAAVLLQRDAAALHRALDHHTRGSPAGLQIRPNAPPPHRLGLGPW